MLRSRETQFNLSKKNMTDVTCFHGQHFSCLEGIYTVLQKYVHIGLKQNLLRSTTVNIITRLLDNAAFVCDHVMGRFSEHFSEVSGLRSRAFQTTVLCAEL